MGATAYRWGGENGRRGAIAKWQAIAEEAGTEHSGFCREIENVKQNPHSKFALQRSCKEQLRDMWDNLVSNRAMTTLMQRVGHAAMYIRWCKSMCIPPFELSERKFVTYCDNARREKAPPFPGV